MFASAVMRSTEAADLTARPQEERAPRRHWMAERRRLKDSWHLSQLRVVLYGWYHFQQARKQAFYRRQWLLLQDLRLQRGVERARHVQHIGSVGCSYFSNSCFLKLETLSDQVTPRNPK